MAGKLKPYYVEFGIDPSAPVPTTNRTPFNSEMCAVVEELKPDVVSFHYGLPEAGLVETPESGGLQSNLFLRRRLPKLGP